ncbi:GNAT family N-acetyltransferase [Arthrobacter sp. HLT1-20]
MTSKQTVPWPVATGLAFRPLAVADAGAWLSLVVRIAEAEDAPWHDQRSDLMEVLGSAANPAVDNTLVGIDEDGVPRVYGYVTKNAGGPVAFLFGGVDPHWQRRGIGAAVLGWQQDVARARFAAEGQAGAAARCFSRAENAAHAALLTTAGFGMVRYFSEMERPLTGIPAPMAARGVSVVPFTPALGEAVRLAHNEAFADHWGSESRSPEKWEVFLKHESFRPDLSAVAVDRATGEVAGYQMSMYDADAFAKEGRRCGYTDILGVRRAWRGRGIAPALLIDAMARYKAAGMDAATLDVDTDNPSGAVALYKNLGYSAIPGRVTVAWDKHL